MVTSTKGNGDTSNAEVVSLLNIIGKRLIKNDKDRINLKDKVDALKEKAHHSDHTITKLQSQIEKNLQKGNDLSNRQNRLETSYDNFAKKIQHIDTLSGKLESTIEHQNKLNRRLEHIIQDRARMLRKLEQIEETVIGTKNALEAKAMVLLTDKDIADDSTLPQISAKKDIESRMTSSNDNKGFWASPLQVKSVAIIGLLIFTAVSAAIIFKIDMKDLSQAASSYNVAQATAEHDSIVEHVTADVSKSFPETIVPASEQTSGDLLQQTPPTQVTKDFIQQSPPTITDKAIQSADLGLDSDNELLMAMNTDPDLVAAQLNDISPAIGPADALNRAADPKQDSLDNSYMQKAAFTDTPDVNAPNNFDAPKNEFDIKAFLDSNRSNTPISKRLPPDPDLPDIMKELEKKAFEGMPEAQHDLAAIYTAGHGGVTVNYNRAAEWFKEAGYNGIGNARYNLGVLYHQGIGVEQNTDTAIGWYKAAADLDHPEAQYNLGIAYIEGIGVSFNADLAAKYFEQAARSGITEAAYNLGLIYENGLVNNSSPEDALFWYQMASDQGSPEAKTAMEQLSQTQGNKTQAIGQSDLTLQDKQHTTSVANNSLPPSNEVIKTIPSLSQSDLEGPYDNQNTVSNEINKQSIVVQTQEQLMFLGRYPGPADGSYSPLLEDSIRSYQQEHGLSPTGQTSESLLAHLLSSAQQEEFGSREY